MTGWANAFVPLRQSSLNDDEWFAGAPSPTLLKVVLDVMDYTEALQGISYNPEDKRLFPLFSCI